MTAEEWRDIAGFPGYRVSNLGRVFSDKSGRVLAPWSGRNQQYPAVSLHRKGAPVKHAKIHILVAEAFHGPRPLGLEIRHLDGDKNNPAALNLAYGTRSENVLDRVAHGTHNHASKTHCKRGHEFNERNTYRSPSRPDKRICRACERLRLSRLASGRAVAS